MKADALVCHSRGICALVGAPLWFGALVACVLLAVAVLALLAAVRGEKRTCVLAVAAASLLFSAWTLLELGPSPLDFDESRSAAALVVNGAMGDFPIFWKLDSDMGRRPMRASPSQVSEVRTKVQRSLALDIASRYDAVLIPVDGTRGRWWFATPDPTREPPAHYGSHWYRKTLLELPHRQGSQSILENALARLTPGGTCPDNSWVVLNAGAHLGRWPAIAASQGCKAISVEAMPWILPFLHLTREVNGWRDLWTPLDGAIGDRDGALLNVSGGDGQGVSGVRSSGALYDTQVTRARLFCPSFQHAPTDPRPEQARSPPRYAHTLSTTSRRDSPRARRTHSLFSMSRGSSRRRSSVCSV